MNAALIRKEVVDLCEAIRKAGGRALLVGGCVRDLLVDKVPKDYDLEVYNLPSEKLRDVLLEFGPVNTVGESFAVYKMVFSKTARSAAVESSPDAAPSKFEIDVSIPRRESKSGRGHRAFEIHGDPEMTFEEAARRRDFTVNAILYDPLDRNLIDPYDGARDLERLILRVVDPATFVDDSLRVLRAVQLAARFEFSIDPRTAELCRSIDLSDLPVERVWGEVEKLLTLARRPSIGLAAALELNAAGKVLPKFANAALADKQRFARVCLAIDEAALLAEPLTEGRRIAVMLSVVTIGLHCSDPKPGLERLAIQTLGGFDVRGAVLAVVGEREKVEDFYRRRASAAEFRRLAVRVELDLLYRAIAAFESSRDAAQWFISRARELSVEHAPPPPLLKGRHLLELGIEPGPRMGELLRRIYDQQLDGEVSTLNEALTAAKKMS